MILTIDVGNTNVVIGCVDNGEVRSAYRLATNLNDLSSDYALRMRQSFEFDGIDYHAFTGAILSSVVPQLNRAIRSAVKKVTGLDCMVVGAGIKTGVNVKIDDPGTLAGDIVVGSVAAMGCYGTPCIVLDMGTATTISAVDAQGRFAGGAIVPGLRLSMESLSGHTSQLPRVSLDAPAKCIGTNTVACMQSGAIYGSAALLDGMIERMETELGAPAAVIATGGLAGCVTPFCRREIRYEPDLLLIGLAVLWEKNRSGKKA